MENYSDSTNTCKSAGPMVWIKAGFLRSESIEWRAAVGPYQGRIAADVLNSTG